ncbi:MAG: hypothetical protein LAN36_06035 [Acidobacteriia bacterium]|nr:hypothetical protein [Terriglobia bacterium]
MSTTVRSETGPYRPELLVQVHVAEYQALMERLTNWITLQCSLWAVFVFYLALVAQVWQSFQNKCLLVWVSVFIFEVVELYWCYWQMETYRNVAYVEKVLRPLVESQVGHSPFWRYERHIAWTRGEGFIWWEWSNVVYPVLVLGAAAIWRRPWSAWDSLGLIFAVLMYAGVVVVAVDMLKTRRSIFR